MKHKPALIVVALLLVTGVLTTTHAEKNNGSGETTEATVAKVYTASETAPFTTLAKETLEALAAGKKEEMVTKLTDLETAWDDQEKTLKPRDEATWTTIDKTLDKAISSLRSSKYNEQRGGKALQSLLVLIDQATQS